MSRPATGVEIVEGHNDLPLSPMHLAGPADATALCDRRIKNRVRAYNRARDGRPDWLCGMCLLAYERGTA